MANKSTNKMSNKITLEDVWKLFQETDRKFQETDKRWQETDKKWQETDRKWQETDRKWQETDKKWQETDIKWQETVKMWQETNRRLEENDRKWHETDRSFLETKLIVQQTSKTLEKTGRYLDDVGKRVDGLTGKWSLFVENMVAPACTTLFAARNIPVHQVAQRVIFNLDDRNMEIDVMVVNAIAAILVEVKSTLTVADVRHHLQRLQEFKTFAPRYADCQIMGAVAAIVYDGKSNIFAQNRGLFVLSQSGKTLQLANKAEFIPRTW